MYYQLILFHSVLLMFSIADLFYITCGPLYNQLFSLSASASKPASVADDQDQDEDDYDDGDKNDDQSVDSDNDAEDCQERAGE